MIPHNKKLGEYHSSEKYITFIRIYFYQIFIRLLSDFLSCYTTYTLVPHSLTLWARDNVIQKSFNVKKHYSKTICSKQKTFQIFKTRVPLDFKEEKSKKQKTKQNKTSRQKKNKNKNKKNNKQLRLYFDYNFKDDQSSIFRNKLLTHFT